MFESIAWSEGGSQSYDYSIASITSIASIAHRLGFVKMDAQRMDIRADTGGLGVWNTGQSFCSCHARTKSHLQIILAFFCKMWYTILKWNAS